MKFLAPWLLTFAFGFGVFLVGRYLQRRENERRLLRKKMSKAEDVMASVATAYHPPRQSEDSLGKYGMKEQQGSVGRFTS